MRLDSITRSSVLQRRAVAALLALITSALTFSPLLAQVQRLPGSPYPAAQQPDILILLDDGAFSRSQRLVLATLQGMLARSKPRIYRIYHSGAAFWLQQLARTQRVSVDSSYLGRFGALVEHFAGEIPGYVLCDLDDGSVNAGITLAAARGALCATPTDTADLRAAGLRQLVDVRGKDEGWLATQVDTLLVRNLACYQKEEKVPFLADYGVFARCWYFYEPISSPVTRLLFARLEPNAALLGWGEDEHTTVQQVSRAGVFLHAADWAANLSVLTNFEAETHQFVRPASGRAEQNTHTVCFLMTDGDNIQWMLNDFVTSERWYGSPSRGTVPLGWTVSPALCELAPTILSYLYTHASPAPNADEFIAGPSGLGYMYPSHYPASERDAYASLAAAFMRKADLRIVNVIDDVLDEDALRSLLRQDQIDAVFFNPYANYAGLHGEIRWLEGKPVISARFRLWGGFETTASLAAKLNALPRNPDEPSGYSLVAVHVWTNSVDSVVACVRRLDEHVRVVAPSEFVRLVSEHLSPPSGVKQGEGTPGQPAKFALFPATPNPFNATTLIRYRLPTRCQTELAIYDSVGQRVQTFVSRRVAAGEHAVHWDASALPSGVYVCRLQAGEWRAARKLVLVR